MAPTLLRRNVLLHFFREKNQADFVIVADGGKGQDGGDFGGQFALRLFARTEEAGPAEIDHQHERQFAFFDKFFDKWMIHARRDIPINGADFIPRLVLAHLLKVHALPLSEDAMILSAEGFQKPAAWCRSSIWRIFLSISRGIMEGD